MTVESHRFISILRCWRMSSPHFATLFILGTVVLSGAIAAAWFAGEGTISMLFQRLDQLQENSPMWIEAPMMVGNYLLFWTVTLMLVVIAITKISPRPHIWSRTVVVGILLVLAVRYLLWRSLSA
jgi:cellulose synthase (UDP-forming)